MQLRVPCEVRNFLIEQTSQNSYMLCTYVSEILERLQNNVYIKNPKKRGSAKIPAGLPTGTKKK